MVMTSCEMSMRLHSKSEMTSCACATAPVGSLQRGGSQRDLGCAPGAGKGPARPPAAKGQKPGRNPQLSDPTLFPQRHHRRAGPDTCVPRGGGAGGRALEPGGGPHAPVDEQATQRGGDEVGHQGAIVPAHGLQALAVHTVMGVRPGGEEQARIPLLADEQVGEVDLGESRLGLSLWDCGRRRPILRLP